jgi:hypothetical protein
MHEPLDYSYFLAVAQIFEMALGCRRLFGPHRIEDEALEEIFPTLEQLDAAGLMSEYAQEQPMSHSVVGSFPTCVYSIIASAKRYRLFRFLKV